MGGLDRIMWPFISGSKGQRQRGSPRDLKSEKDSTKGKYSIADFEDGRAKKQDMWPSLGLLGAGPRGDSQSGNRDVSPPAARH